MVKHEAGAAACPRRLRAAAPRVRVLLGASAELLSGIIPLAFDTFLDMIISLRAVYQ